MRPEMTFARKGKTWHNTDIFNLTMELALETTILILLGCVVAVVVVIALIEWRTTLMSAIGVILGFATAGLLGNEGLGIPLGGIVFLSFMMWGIVWQDKFNTRRVR